MNAHALAKLLLSGPDLPVVINTGSSEDEPTEVDGELTEHARGSQSFLQSSPLKDTNRPHVTLR